MLYRIHSTIDMRTFSTCFIWTKRNNIICVCNVHVKMTIDSLLVCWFFFHSALSSLVLQHSSSTLYPDCFRFVIAEHLALLVQQHIQKHLSIFSLFLSVCQCLYDFVWVCYMWLMQWRRKTHFASVSHSHAENNTNNTNNYNSEYNDNNRIAIEQWLFSALKFSLSELKAKINSKRGIFGNEILLRQCFCSRQI